MTPRSIRPTEGLWTLFERHQPLVVRHCRRRFCETHSFEVWRACPRCWDLVFELSWQLALDIDRRGRRGDPITEQSLVRFIRRNMARAAQAAAGTVQRPERAVEAKWIVALLPDPAVRRAIAYLIYFATSGDRPEPTLLPYERIQRRFGIDRARIDRALRALSERNPGWVDRNLPLGQRLWFHLGDPHDATWLADCSYRDDDQAQAAPSLPAAFVVSLLTEVRALIQQGCDAETALRLTLNRPGVTDLVQTLQSMGIWNELIADLEGEFGNPNSAA